jgi:hypothetical protein
VLPTAVALMVVSYYQVVTSNGKSELALNEIRHAVLAAGDLYGKHPELFRLFGDFDGTKDLLFKVRSSVQPEMSTFCSYIHILFCRLLV